MASEYIQIVDALTGQPSTQCVMRASDGAFIPFDPDNVDYAAYLAWLAEGKTPDAPHEPSH